MAQVKLHKVNAAGQSVGMRLAYMPVPHKNNNCAERGDYRWDRCKPLETISHIFGVELQEITDIYNGMESRVNRALEVTTVEI